MNKREREERESVREGEREGERKKKDLLILPLTG
jgi:hypothetical protein